MNPAQKRSLWTCIISLLTLVISGVVSTMITQGKIDLGNHTVYQIVGASGAIPLVLIVILSTRYPRKAYDERDRLIDNKSLIWGFNGTFIFMALAAWLFAILYFRGIMTTLKTLYIAHFFYIIAFVWLFLSSAVGVVLYYYENICEKKHNFKGEFT